MVSSADLEKYFKEMQEIFGDSLPNFEQEPVRFKYYVKLYLYYYKEKTNE